jgi:nitroreductase
MLRFFENGRCLVPKLGQCLFLHACIQGVRKVLNIPETIVPLNLIAIGHPAEEKEPRTQYDEVQVHLDHW